MSNKHNYTNYSKPQQPAPVAEPEVTEEVVVEESVVAPAAVVEEPFPMPEPVVEESTEILGVVTECARLNVRKEPSTDADVVTTILLGTEVMVDVYESTEEFYKICTGAGIEGYCMKKFINVA